MTMRERIRIAAHLQRHIEQIHHGVYDDTCPFYRVLLTLGVIDANGNPKAPLT